MGFKLNKSSDNLFHKVSESKLDGGKVTQQPDVAMEAPSSPAKLGPIGTGLLGAAAGYFAKKVFGGSDKPAKPPQKKDLSMTPHSSKDGKGTIHGPKVSYDMAYNKAKKTKQYANMSKDEYVTEAKRQTANFKKTGKWDASGASKPRKKVETVSAIKPASVKPSAAKPTATVEIKKPVQAAESKPAKQTRSQKLRSKGEAVLSNDKFSTAKKQRKSKRIRKRYDKAVAKEQKNENKKTKKSSSPDYSGGMM